jgi:hypothetical protein
MNKCIFPVVVYYMYPNTHPNYHSFALYSCRFIPSSSHVFFFIPMVFSIPLFFNPLIQTRPWLLKSYIPKEPTQSFPSNRANNVWLL